MYNAKFVNNNGKVFNFGYENGNIFDIDGLTGYDVKISASQGFQQIGETVENQSTGSGLLKISGCLLDDATDKKRELLSAFPPMSTGRLFFNEEYFIDCAVKKTPAISVVKRNPKFTLQLFTPFPFWQSIKTNSFVIGDYTPAFSFPVNYAKPHIFGIKSDSLFINCYNAGMVETDYKLVFRTFTKVTNPSIINAQTQEKLSIKGEIQAGEELTVYKVENRLRVELTQNGVVKDVFSWLDEDSDLLSLHVGDNIIRATAEEGEDQLIVSITFNDTVVGVYEGM